MLKVSCAIIIKNKKILVTQRNKNSGNPLKWEFPGGKQEAKETIEECMLREIKEELDLKIIIQKKLFPIIHKYEFGKIKLIPFICSIHSGELKLIEHHNYNWTTLNKINRFEFTPADKKLIELNKNITILKKYLWENVDNS